MHSLESTPVGSEDLAEKQRSILERSKPFYRDLKERVATSRLAKAVAGMAMLTASEGCAGNFGAYVKTDWPAHTIAQSREMKETVEASRKAEQVPLSRTSTGEIITREDGSYAMAVRVWVKDRETPEDHQEEALAYVRKDLPHRGVKTTEMKAEEQTDPEQKKIVDEYGPRVNYRGFTVGSKDAIEFVRALPRPGLAEAREADRIRQNYHLESDTDTKALERTARTLMTFKPYLESLSAEGLDPAQVKKYTDGFVRGLQMFRRAQDLQRLVGIAKTFVEVSGELRRDVRVASMSGAGIQSDREMIFRVIRNKFLEEVKKANVEEIVHNMQRLVHTEDAMQKRGEIATSHGTPEGTEYVFSVPLVLKTSGTSIDKPIEMTPAPPALDEKPNVVASVSLEKGEKRADETQVQNIVRTILQERDRRMRESERHEGRRMSEPGLRIVAWMWDDQAKEYRAFDLIGWNFDPNVVPHQYRAIQGKVESRPVPKTARYERWLPTLKEYKEEPDEAMKLAKAIRRVLENRSTIDFILPSGMKLSKKLGARLAVDTDPGF